MSFFKKQFINFYMNNIPSHSHPHNQEKFLLFLFLLVSHILTNIFPKVLIVEACLSNAAGVLIVLKDH